MSSPEFVLISFALGTSFGSLACMLSRATLCARWPVPVQLL
ncbi:hypothetical protein [Kitasatospora sp. NPDC088346]